MQNSTFGRDRHRGFSSPATALDKQAASSRQPLRIRADGSEYTSGDRLSPGKRLLMEAGRYKYQADMTNYLQGVRKRYFTV